MSTENIHPEFGRFLKREEKESLLDQRGMVCWMYGLSGSGKSTIANAAERVLHQEGRMTVILDGDNLRSGLNKNLGFSDEDRRENVRRTAELAKIFASQGIITFVSVITPRKEFRDRARDICGDDFFEVYVKASYEACAERDPKGLYAKAAKDQVTSFTGKDSGFDEPEHPDLVLDTEENSVEDNTFILIESLRKRIEREII
ncbi:MAG: adenylyl-sulfate kinase [Verrucomicrobiales bacterium]